MRLEELIRKVREQINARVNLHNDYARELGELRGQDAPDAAKVEELRGKKAGVAAEIDSLRQRLAELERELEQDLAVARLQEQTGPSGAPQGRAYDQVARVGAEKRTYSPDTDRKGVQFLTDVARQFLFHDPGASERLSRHMQEERVERGDAVAGQFARAAGTGAFAGLVVPQYLTDLYAPAAKKGRPFADAMRKHDLPETGMTASIGRVTTETVVDVQAAENTNVAEQDMDDTLMSISIQTNAGQQTLSRQAIERGVGVEDTMLDDLYRSYAASLDNKVLNQATNGLTNVATAIAYTDTTPTATELYPKLLQGPAEVEAALLDQSVGDTIAVMHSRRWYWLQSQLTSTYPILQQPNLPPQVAGKVNDETYGSGFRGVLPSGVPVIVDNNIATNLGAGTNEDEIYFVAQSEAHLWEDPQAPMLIRAEQTKAASLGVLFVVYGYFAYTFVRRPHARKIGGTGLVTPAFA